MVFRTTIDALCTVEGVHAGGILGGAPGAGDQ